MTVQKYTSIVGFHCIAIEIKSMTLPNYYKLLTKYSVCYFRSICSVLENVFRIPLLTVKPIETALPLKI